MSLFTPQEVAALEEIVSLLDDAYRHYFANSDGYSKLSEGSLSVSFGTFYDRRDGERIRYVQVYSYVLGPSRTHHFDTIADALRTVREWHAGELATDYAETQL